MLENLRLGANVKQEVEKDVVRGANFGPVESGLYDLTLKAAYFGKSSGGAMSVTLLMETADGRRITETEYITSGTAKGGKPTYTAKKDSPDGKIKAGDEVPLPGYARINAVCQLLGGNSIDQLTAAEKVLKLYDFTAKAETNQNKTIIEELTNVKFKGGVLREIVNKRQKNDQTGEYEAIADTRTQNIVDKFFNEDGLTLEEVVNGKPSVFAAKWLEKNEGQDLDSTTIKAEGNAGAPSLGGAPAATGTPALNFS